MNILESASKIVFILMAVAVVGLTFIGKVDPKDFMMLAAMVFSFYFSYKGSTDNTTSTTTSTSKTDSTTEVPPFAGK